MERGINRYLLKDTQLVDVIQIKMGKPATGLPTPDRRRGAGKMARQWPLLHDQNLNCALSVRTLSLISSVYFASEPVADVDTFSFETMS